MEFWHVFKCGFAVLLLGLAVIVSTWGLEYVETNGVNDVTGAGLLLLSAIAFGISLLLAESKN